MKSWVNKALTKHILIGIYLLIKKKDSWRKGWFCIQMLNETNLIDVDSTKPIWTSMWLPLLIPFLKAVNVEWLTKHLLCDLLSGCLFYILETTMIMDNN